MNRLSHMSHHFLKRMTALVGLIAASALAAHAQAVFSPAKVISNPSNYSFGDQIAIDSRGNIYVAWVDTTPPCPCSYTVWFSRSSDGGVTFSAPLSISHAGSDARFHGIAVAPSGSISILWSDNSLGHYAEFFSGSTDGGSTFSTPLVISNAGADVITGGIAIDSGGNIDVIWNDNSPGYYAVFFSHSTDGGTNFSSPVNISNNPLGAGTVGMSMSVDSKGDVYLAWVALATFVFNGVTDHGNEIFFSGSADGGTTFSSPTSVTGFQGRNAQFPGLQVAADSMSNLTVLWQLSYFGPTTLLYSYSIDAGTTFQTASVMAGCEFLPNPHMVLDSLGGANFVWQESCGEGASDVIGARYAGGLPVARYGWHVIHNNTPLPQLAVDSSNNIDVFFTNGPAVSGPYQPLFTRSSDGGATFSAPQNAPGVPDSIVTDSSGDMYFSWSSTHIYFSRSVALVSLALSPAVVTSGGSSTGTVTLNGPAPIGGAAISLSSSDPSASVPATVTVSQGTTTAMFTVTTSPVAAPITAIISAAFNGVTQTTSITVDPLALTSLTLNPSSVTGPSSSIGTVMLSGPAPAGGALVTLSSSDASIATVPASVTVPSGFTNATFTVNTRRELCSNTATISASFTGLTLTAQLAVETFLPVTLPPQACAAIGAHDPPPAGWWHWHQREEDSDWKRTFLLCADKESCQGDDEGRMQRE